MKVVVIGLKNHSKVYIKGTINEVMPFKEYIIGEDPDTNMPVLVMAHQVMAMTEKEVEVPSNE